MYLVASVNVIVEKAVRTAKVRRSSHPQKYVSLIAEKFPKEEGGQ